MKSRLLTDNYERYDVSAHIDYVMPDGYYPIDKLSDCDESDYEDLDEVWLGYNQQTLAEYMAIAYDTVSLMLIKVFHRKSASCKLVLKPEVAEDVEAIIVHSNGMVQLYPYTDGDISDELQEYFDYEDVEYGGSIGGDAYLVSNGKLYDYRGIK